jgi:hypothetical protein
MLILFVLEGPTPHNSHIKICNFSKNAEKYPTSDNLILRSTWSIWARLYLLERSDSLPFIKNMKIGIYHLVPILGRRQYLVDCIFRGISDEARSLWGLKPPTIALYKTSIKILYTFRAFAKKKIIFF